MQILQRNQIVGRRGQSNSPSFLLALDPNTGKELWRHERPSQAKMESLESYATPIPFEHKGRKELLIAGGDVISGHDPETGKEFWRWGTWNPNHREMWWRLVVSPVVGKGVVLVCGPKRAPVFAAKAGGNGDISTTGLAWSSAEKSQVTSDVPTPLFYKDRFYVLSDQRKSLSRVEPETGKVFWTTPIEGICWGSPTGADDKIYLFALNGVVTVVDSESGKILSTNPMATEGEDDMRSTISIGGNNLFIRTTNYLYCVGK